jgi:hypothetical protein
VFYNNFLVRNPSDKSTKFFSVKQLYVLQCIFNKYSLNKPLNKPIDFYIITYLSWKIIHGIYIHLFFTFLFFLKTYNLLSVKEITSKNHSYSTQALFCSILDQNSFSKFNLFWKKWKNLKRPVAESEVNEFYLNDFKKKLNIYLELGLINVYNRYVILKPKSYSPSELLVSFNKPLLSSPKYASSTIHKNLYVSEINNFEFQFLRKNKVYNKGRYSRTRQNYRTGVYMCMYVSVISVFGLYYWFYKFSFNFTYLWWLFITFLGSFFFPKIVKYRLYEPSTILNKFFDFFRWFNLLIRSIFF